MEAASLLAGPRGRRLLELARSGDPDPLPWVVGTAHYWQPPDNDEGALAYTAASGQYDEIAREVAARPENGWWSTPLARSTQFVVRFRAPDLDEPEPSWVPGDSLVRWRDSMIAAEEASLPLSTPLEELPSAAWWAIPAFTRLPITTRNSAEGPVRLTLVEDSLGWVDAEVTAVSVPETARVFEIRGADDWCELVENFAFDCTRSHRRCWNLSTGVDGGWFMPDWLAVSERFDGVHLSVEGYLATAGRALPVADGHTVLAGFAPDETYWLGPVVTPDGPTVIWHRNGSGEPWERSTDGS